ncbi:SCO2322 family protein [Allostreptomyces psammosilenae]|uniref:Secreted protein n=1 Tax=Allostreptomyces psammosilenae TaxID=1892865 RepID=A0A852ZWM1_9ACTN|nr:SCO2322 family protein [Allostreptomyces psammosilenae]NYI06793.1 hypothetical protein [Allostreptomyces psammosilenae]
MTRPSPTRRAPRALVACLLPAALLLGTAAPAQAVDYRYWSFWQSETSPGASARWSYATAGPATAVPADGTVDGWRFAVTSEGGAVDAAPADGPDFAALCADTPERSGRKRVGLVVDPGGPADAPAGQTPPAAWSGCLSVAEDATSAEVLAAVPELLPLRYGTSGMLCAIAGYPTDECGAPVERDDAPTPSPGAPTGLPSALPSGYGLEGGEPSGSLHVVAGREVGGSGGSAGWGVGVALLLALAAGAGVQRVRRARSRDDR